jgi:hypothetical protein
MKTQLIGILFAAIMVDAVAADRGLRFDSPGVLDISAEKVSMSGSPVSVAALDAADASSIAGAPKLSEDASMLPFSSDVFGCGAKATDCVTKNEAKRIADSGGAAKRDDKRLTITPSKGSPAVFADWKDIVTKSIDGESEIHWYLGALKGSGYQRVEVQFQHDSPGSFLINPANGKSLFVHNGSDVSALSPDGQFLLNYDELNAPLTLRMASLDANGPAMTLQCKGPTADEGPHFEFKGWHDAANADLALVGQAARSKLAHAAAVRLRHSAAGWEIATDHPESLKEAGFSCQQAK